MTALCSNDITWPVAVVLIVLALCMTLLAAAIAGVKPREPK